MRTESGTLTVGDYSLAGMERIIAIERKSLADFVWVTVFAQDRGHHRRPATHSKPANAFGAAKMTKDTSTQRNAAARQLGASGAKTGEHERP
jgi:hypothetical protein